MAGRAKYEVLFAPETVEHMSAIEAKHHGYIARTIDQQLRHAAESATRNRKPLDDSGPLGATWELRCSPQNRFRIFYDVHSAELEVHVLAIGVKERNKLYIAAKEFVP